MNKSLVWKNTEPPCEPHKGYVKLEDGTIKQAIRRARYRNGSLEWAWFDLKGFVIDWVNRVVEWC